MTAQEQYELGNKYYFGKDGCAKDLGRARAYYQEAVRLDPRHAWSLYMLGWFHQYGEGNVKKNLAEARKYYERAVAEGHYESKKQVLILENSRLVTAEKWYELGLNYYDEKKYVEARACWERASDLNKKYPYPSYCLGILHEHGWGDLQKNQQKATEYYQRSADNGYFNANKKIFTTAAQWFEFGECYYYGRDNKQQCYEKARLCYEEAIAIDPKHTVSLYCLGWIYEYGLQVNKDLSKARHYYQASASQGDVNARNQLILLMFDAVVRNDIRFLETIIHDNQSLLNECIIETRSCCQIAKANIAWYGKKTIGYGNAAFWSLGALAVLASPPVGFAVLEFLTFTGVLTGAGIGLAKGGDSSLAQYTYNHQKWTVLHFAAALNLTEVAVLLLKYGADENLIDAAGRTFLDIASNIGSDRKEFIMACHKFIEGRDSKQAEITDLQRELSDVKAERNEAQSFVVQLDAQLEVAEQRLANLPDQFFHHPAQHNSEAAAAHVPVFRHG